MTILDTERTRFVLNGQEVNVRSDHPHALAALREELDVTSPKDGCSPSGQCGCCTVLLDGKAVVACQMPLTRSPGSRSQRSKASIRPSANASRTPSPPTARCSAASARPASSCTRRRSSTRRAPTSSATTRPRHLGAHLCRCTGYVTILDAIESLAAGTDTTPTDVALPRGIGTDGMKYEARELALGDRDLRRRHSHRRDAARHAPAHRPRPRRHRAHRYLARSRRPVCVPFSPPPTCPATCASASSIATGRS